MNILTVFYTYTTNIAQGQGCDAVFNEEGSDNGYLLCDIVKRDTNGDILRNYLRYELRVHEEKGKGLVVFRRGKKEIEELPFSLENAHTLPEIFVAMDHHLTKIKEEEQEEEYLSK